MAREGDEAPGPRTPAARPPSPTLADAGAHSSRGRWPRQASRPSGLPDVTRGQALRGGARALPARAGSPDCGGIRDGGRAGHSGREGETRGWSPLLAGGPAAAGPGPGVALPAARQGREPPRRAGCPAPGLPRRRPGPRDRCAHAALAPSWCSGRAARGFLRRLPRRCRSRPSPQNRVVLCRPPGRQEDSRDHCKC